MKLSDQLRNELIERALKVRRNAYAPYSKYAVGAALLADSGEIYTGSKVENSAYPVSMCAERSAIFQAVSEGERKFKAIVVATENGGSPCGSCRQVMSEFGLDMLVLMVDEDGKVCRESSVGALLPESFGPGDLNAS
ncbi:MAG TPA: cytidine deaminase [Anaerolineae bacterium]|nr:cytidine deaminase [Anaerolineae bacterium]